MQITPNENDNVNHPRHYTSRNTCCTQCGKYIECIDVTRHLNFNLGNAMKYIWRADFKAKPIEDLKKAVWYLQDEIAKREKLAAFQESTDFKAFVVPQMKKHVCGHCYLSYDHVEQLDQHLTQCASAE